MFLSPRHSSPRDLAQRIRRAMEQGDDSEIESALNEPFDDPEKLDRVLADVGPDYGLIQGHERESGVPDVEA